jgi:hypothetical protein
VNERGAARVVAWLQGEALGPAGGHVPEYGLPSGEQGLSPISHCSSPFTSIQTKELIETAPFVTL